MQTLTRAVDTTQRRLTLDEEVSLWSKKGYRVLSRTSTTAQLCKPHTSPLLVGALILVAVILLQVFGTTLWSPIQGGAIFVVGTVLLSAWHVVRGEKLVYLTIAPDGEITQD